jgi:hypothetical protein
MTRLRASPLYEREDSQRSGKTTPPDSLSAADSLDTNARTALQLLERWHIGAGGNASNTCETLCSEHPQSPLQCAIDPSRLGKLALAASGSEYEPAVDAVLHLAHVMRAAGQQADFLRRSTRPSASLPHAETC